jgi:hypothetical protein
MAAVRLAHGSQSQDDEVVPYDPADESPLAVARDGEECGARGP